MSDLIERIEALEKVSQIHEVTQLKMQEVLPMVIEMIKDDCNNDAIIARIIGLLDFCQITREVEPEATEEPLQEFSFECVALEPNLYNVTVSAHNEEEAKALVREHGISAPTGYHTSAYGAGNVDDEPVYYYEFVENANGRLDEATATITKEKYDAAVWQVVSVASAS